MKTTMHALLGIEGSIRIISMPILRLLGGDYHAAVFLSQCAYLSSKRDDGWFYKTYPEWQTDLMLSEYQIRNAAAVLKRMGLLEIKKEKVNGAPTLHYRVTEQHLEKLARLILGSEDEYSESEETSDSNLENPQKPLTTELTATEEQVDKQRQLVNDGENEPENLVFEPVDYPKDDVLAPKTKHEVALFDMINKQYFYSGKPIRRWKFQSAAQQAKFNMTIEREKWTPYEIEVFLFKFFGNSGQNSLSSCVNWLAKIKGKPSPEDRKNYREFENRKNGAVKNEPIKPDKIPPEVWENLSATDKENIIRSPHAWKLIIDAVTLP